MKGFPDRYRFPDRLRAYFLDPARRGLWFSLAILLFLLLPLWWYALLRYEEVLVRELRAHETIHLTVHGNAVAKAINERFALLEGLYAFALANPSDDFLKKSFDVFASGLYSGAAGIRNFALAPGGVQRYVYPLPGNENVLGHDLINDPRPQVRTDVLRAIATRKIALSGPYELRQGGMGLVARKALYVNDAIWGLATMVIDLPPILTEAGLSHPQPDIEMALWDNSKKVISGNISVFENDPVLLRIELPEGYWELGGIPPGGWRAAILGRIFLFQAGGLIIAFLIAVVAYLVVGRQLRLEREVGKRTTELVLANEKLNREIEERGRTQKALAESEALYRNLLDAAPAGIAVHCEGKIVFTNPAGVRLLGGTSEEQIVGRSIVEIIHPDGLQQSRTRIQKMLAGEKGLYPVEDVYLKLDGPPVNVEVMATALTYEGKPAVQVIVTDITARKLAEETLWESEERFRAIAANTPDHILIQDKDLRYIFVANPQLGLTEADMLGRTDYDFLSKEEADKLTTVKRQVMETGKSFHFEPSLISREGRPEFFDGVYVPKFDATGKVDGLIGYFRNVTERKRVEDEIRRLNAELEERVRERTAELEAKIAEIERMNKLFVGRELRMAELKEKIKELESEAGGHHSG